MPGIHQFSGWCIAVLFLMAMLPFQVQAQETQPLTIQTGQGPKIFQIELVDSDEKRMQGLMYRQSMADDRGMLFDFKDVAPVSMWMKNTYISLDMLFIRADGTIARIASRTEPLSTRVIPSGEPVLAVLELVGGVSRKLGIKAGDRVEHPLFRK